MNDRYDAGMWCDTLDGMKDNDYDNFFLINDSVMAIRQSDEFLTTLVQRNMSLVSMNYWTEEYYWLESVARAFSRDGIRVYQNQLCSGLRKSLKQCTRFGAPWKQKACIVSKTEIAVAGFYSRNDTWGIYPGMVSRDFRAPRKNYPWGSGHYEFWKKHLLDTLNFPVMKVSGDMLRETLMRYPNRTQLFECTSSFESNKARKRLMKTSRVKMRYKNLPKMTRKPVKGKTRTEVRKYQSNPVRGTSMKAHVKSQSQSVQRDTIKKHEKLGYEPTQRLIPKKG